MLCGARLDLQGTAQHKSSPNPDHSMRLIVVLRLLSNLLDVSFTPDFGSLFRNGNWEKFKPFDVTNCHSLLT